MRKFSPRRLAVYLLLFGILTLYVTFFRSPEKQYLPAEVLGAKTGLSLFVEPQAGRKPLLEKIQAAREEIFVTVYLLSDPEIITALAETDRRGVDVRVILEEKVFGPGNLNKTSKPELEAAGIETRWDRLAAFTHQKSLVIDSRVVCVLNLNLTRAAFEKNREYNVCSANPEDATEARAIFLADWEGKNYQPKTPNLVVSPDNSRGKLTAFIRAAQSSLDVEMEILEDGKIIDLLVEKAKTIPVRIILPDLKRVDVNTPAADKLLAGGAAVRTLSSPYPHAKLILADGQRAYLGSVNLSGQSLDENRELGILVAQADIVAKLQDTFNADFLFAVSH